MTLDSDFIVDRRRMRRRLALWRGLAVLAIAGAIIALSFAALPVNLLDQNKRQDHIARITIVGVITDDRRQLQLIERVKKADRVKGVLLVVASPGGTASGGEALYEALRDLAGEKPMVTHISGLAASAGYMVAVASDHIVARSNAIAGSIGVLFQYADASGLLQNIGVNIDAIKSSEIKAEPDFYSAPPDAAKEMIAALVNDSYTWFVDLVEDRRDFTAEQVQAVSDGSIFTGRQALERELVDALGGENVAVSWLEDERDVADDLPIVDWTVARETDGLSIGTWLLVTVADAVGLDASSVLAANDRAKLDGLLAVWHAPGVLAAQNEGASQ